MHRNIPILFSLTIGFLLSFHPGLSADIGMNTAVSNMQNDLLIPYRPGIDFDRLKLNDFGSARSLFPSSSVEIKSQGTPGQLSTASLDGGPASHTVLSMDGVPIETAQTVPMDAGILPTEFFQSADVYKNNLGPYGFTGSSGMINFNLFRPGMDLNELQLYGGSYGSIGGKVLFSQSFQDNDFLIGASYSAASNNFPFVDAWDDTRTAVNSDYTKYSVVSKWALRNWKAGLTYTSREAGSGSGIARQDDGLLTANAGYREGGFLTEVSYVNWANRYRDPALSCHVNQTLQVRTGGALDWDFYRLKPSLNNKVFWVDSTKIGQRTDDEINLVVENGFTFGGDALGLDLNLVLNQVYRFSGGYIPVPALDATFRVTDVFRVIGGLGRCFRFPTFNDLYWPEDSFSKGNPSLKPEDGIDWKTGIVVLYHAFYGSLTYSESYLNGLIVWIDTTGKWTPQNINRTLSRVLAVSGNYEQRFGRLNIKANVSFSVNYSINDDSDSVYYQKRLTYVPLYKIALNFGADYDQSFGFYMLLRQVSERFTTEANTVWLPSYFVMDAKINVYFAFLAVENLFDASFQEIQGYPQPGRTFRAGVDWKF